MKNVTSKLLLCLLLVSAIALSSCKSEKEQDEPAESVVPKNTKVNEIKPDPKMAAVEIALPKPMFVGTPQNIKVPNLEKASDHKPRPPLMAPAGTVNLALNKGITGSDEEPIIGEMDMITDGDKEAGEGSYVELGPFLQYITVDLGQKSEIFAVLVWHFHKQPRVYKDVVVQLSNDPDFITDVVTIFNNDLDNSAGLGVGSDVHYIETFEGRLINAKGHKAQFVRLYSNGNTSSDMNHYIEVEVYGRPIK